MTLRFAPYHRTESLNDFYRKLAALPKDNPLSTAGAQMLDLLPLLAEACANVDLWGFTSHERLCLRERNEYESPWLVIIDPLPGDGYDVRFRLPDHEAPWPQAMIWGHARSKEAACAMVRVGIARSMAGGRVPDPNEEAAQQ
jgi:hypothetical protein